MTSKREILILKILVNEGPDLTAIEIRTFAEGVFKGTAYTLLDRLVEKQFVVKLVRDYQITGLGVNEIKKWEREMLALIEY